MPLHARITLGNGQTCSFPPQRFVGYARQSTTQQGSDSLRRQEEAIRAFVAGRNGHLIEPIFIEIASEAPSRAGEHRGERERAIETALREHAYLLVTKVHRLTRGIGFLQECRSRGLRIMTIDRPGRTWAQLELAVHAEYRELEDAIENRALGREAARRQGRRGGDPTRGASRTARSEIHARSLLTVIRVIRKRGITSLNGIANALENAEIRTPRGNGRWRAEMVKRLLVKLERQGIALDTAARFPRSIQERLISREVFRTEDAANRWFGSVIRKNRRSEPPK